MANLKKKLDSGAEIEIQMAEFEKGHRLLQAVMKSHIPVESMIDLILSADVQPALWDCLAVCLYNGVKINRGTFDDELARGDYLIVAKEAMTHNIAPFFKGLGSKLSGLPVDANGSAQK
jgi:hypothetical protein